MYDIKDLRSRTQKNQSDFAKWLHIPLKTLQKWEQGVSSPPPYVLELIESKIFYTYMVAPSVPDQTEEFEDFHSAPPSAAPSAAVKEIFRAMFQLDLFDVPCEDCRFGAECGFDLDKCKHPCDDTWEQWKYFDIVQSLLQDNSPEL